MLGKQFLSNLTYLWQDRLSPCLSLSFPFAQGSLKVHAKKSIKDFAGFPCYELQKHLFLFSLKDDNAVEVCVMAARVDSLNTTKSSSCVGGLIWASVIVVLFPIWRMKLLLCLYLASCSVVPSELNQKPPTYTLLLKVKQYDNLMFCGPVPAWLSINLSMCFCSFTHLSILSYTQFLHMYI